MSKVFEKKYQQMVNDGKLFSIATVVRSIKPSSSKAGDKGLIDQEGNVYGWVGGGCTQSIVIHEALLAMKTRKPSLVRIAPNEIIGEENGIKTYKMTCQSGGTVDVFIEPHISKPHIIVTGQSAIAHALVALANVMEYPISVVSANEDESIMLEGVDIYPDFESLGNDYDGFQCIIVATQGDLDEERLLDAIKMRCDYLAFVSSRKKAQSIFANLRSKGITFDQLKHIKTPAGMDLGAQLPGEVAVSIMAEIIQKFRMSGKEPENKNVDTSNEPTSISPKEKTKRPRTMQPNMIVNPVCGIPIMLRSAKHIEEKDGQLMYFCCDGCKTTFDKDPDFYWEKMLSNDLMV